ncbi:MAG: TRL-like family protein [Candidatus Omnitrophica bacterium]|nr:TRL-like family protein [Candidatus Omnitrophota bacterium]
MKGLLLALACIVVLSGCAAVLPQGAFYTEARLPVAAASGDVTYTKIGTSQASSILGLVATGDASIEAAIANGGIKKIKFVDYQAKNILGVFGEYTTTVYGD